MKISSVIPLLMEKAMRYVELFPVVPVCSETRLLRISSSLSHSLVSLF